MQIIEPTFLGYAATEDSGYQIIVDSKGNQIIKLKVKEEDGTISIVGTHNYSGSTTAYLTVGYSLALNKKVASSSSSTVRNGTKNKDFIEVEREDAGIPDQIDGNTVTSYYQITIDDNFIKNMYTVWKTSNGRNPSDKVGSKSWFDYRQDLKNGLTVYMSYIFAVIHRDSTGKIIDQSGSFSNASGASGKLYYTYKAIRDAVNWSDRTKYEILPEYYDLAFTIKLNTFTPAIEFVDTEGNLLVDSNEVYEKYPGKGTGYCLYGGSFIYYLPESAQRIVVDGKKYLATEEARYYRGGKMDESNLSQSIKGDLKAHLPYYRYAAKHGFNDDALMQIVFVPEETPIEVQAINAQTKEVIGRIPCDKAYKELEEEVLLNELPECMYDSAGKEYQLVWETATKDFPTWTMSYYRKGSNPGYYTPDNKYGIGVRRQVAVYIASASFDATKPVKVSAYYQLTGNQEERPPEPGDGQENKNENRIDIVYTESEARVQIGASPRENEPFDIVSGIPVSENLYTCIRGSEYLLKAAFVKVTGKKEIPVNIKRTYHLRWTEPAPTPIPGEEDFTPQTPIYHSETVEVNRTVTLTRDYSYTYIDGLAYYKIHSGTVTNTVFPGGVVTLIPENYTPPSLSYQSFGSDTDAHIVLPNEVKNGYLNLGTKIIDGGYSGRPVISEGDSALKALADAKVGELKCRNDFLNFADKVVLSSELMEKDAPTPDFSVLKKPKIISETTLCKESITIPTDRENGSYPTSAELRYTPVVTFGGVKLKENYRIDDKITPVVIHTPVYCEGVVEADNERYVQLLSPDPECIPLVLDENSLLNDFWISVSNFGFHSERKGYGLGSYEKYIMPDSQGIKQNQVRFPFDVIIDIGNNQNPEDDKILSENTWFTLGLQKQRCYLPMYVKEGIYSCEFRSLALNTGNQTEQTEEKKNTQREHYIATDSVFFQISGRIYGLTLYDIEQDPDWTGVFRNQDTKQLKRNLKYQDILIGKLPSGVADAEHFKVTAVYDYTSGKNNSYGIQSKRALKFTLPLCEGSHPLYQNKGMYKNGYPLHFSLHTTGNVAADSKSYVHIVPEFYWIDEDGRNREKVDVYYKESIGGKTKLILIGSPEDRDNRKQQTVGSQELGIPEEELYATAAANEIDLEDWKSQSVEQYSYGLIQAGFPFRTYTNMVYYDKIRRLAEKSKVNLPEAVELIKLKQSSYFSYNLPVTLYITAKGRNIEEYAGKEGINYMEDFWKKDGYLIVNFRITAVDQNGNNYLDYKNLENFNAYNHCCMWETEGMSKEKELRKGRSVPLEYGDVLVLAVKKGAVSDYQSGGIY